MIATGRLRRAGRVVLMCRRNTIHVEIQDRLYEYMGGIIRNLNGALLHVGGIEDHVHCLVNLPANRTVSDCVRDIKANSSKWINELPETNVKFHWQKGYGAFTVSYSQIEIVRRYIINQREHHRVRSFREEFIELLERHGIEYETKYLFETEHVG